MRESSEQSVYFIEPPEDPGDVPFAFEFPKPSVDALCYGEPGVDEEVVTSVNDTLSNLPRWLRQSFCDSEWMMQVVSYDIATEDYDDQFSEGLVYGSTSYKNHIIKIQNDMRAAANAPIHEMGHWLDSQLGYPTLYSDDFDLIFEGEAEVYRQTFGPTCNWDKQEFFAEGFWCYWKSPLALHKACPEFYTFLHSTLNALKEGYIAG